MGKIDKITKEYIGRPDIFADVFNMFLHDGKELIRPENLRELDTAEIAVPYGETGIAVPEQKYRDILKVMMKDDKYAYCLMGVENQTGIHYAMPVRNGLYDFLQLSHQVSVIEKAHRNDIKVDAEQSIKKRISSGEYLSGFYKGDRLLPVITLVIFWGDVEWDAPLSLKEMYNEVDEKVMKYVPDYRVNLIAPNCMSDEKINEFHSSLKEIMLYIKYSNDIEKLRDIANKDHNFQHLERTAVDILNAVTNSNLKYDSNKEEVDVCKAIIELREEGREEGRREAIIGCAKKYANHNVNENIIINILSEELNLNEEEALNIYYNEVLQ